jgi:serine/threonine protein kinase
MIMEHNDPNQEIMQSILDRLDESRESGVDLSVEQACAGHEHLIPLVMERCRRLERFNRLYGTPAGSDGHDTTIEAKMYQASMLASRKQSEGRRLFLYSEITLDEFHDAGGLSEVFRATDSELLREVAVKVLRPDRMQDEMRLDFNREAEILARMTHPGIVSILGKGETIEGRPFYSMPFLNKGSLAKHIDQYHRDRPNSIAPAEKEFRDLLVCLVNACKTIAYAHSRAIVHRDLKSENIMLGDYGETLVIDWGCARVCKRDSKFKVVDAKTIELQEAFVKEDSHSGLTPRYASPEQLRGNENIGPESDIYSLGGVLFKLLTGESPHQKVPDSQVRRVVLAGTPLNPQHYKRGIPAVLAAICDKAMQFEPCNRYETALAMANDLERYLGDLKTSVEKDSLRDSVARAIRRNPRVITAVIAGISLFGLVMSLLVFAENSARNEARRAAKARLEMAAAMAALAGGSEIESRFAMLEKEAINSALIKALQAIRQSPNDRSLWKVVQGIVDQKSVELKQVQDAQHESLFVISDDGTQIAISPYANSIGKNYAYRDYFHGLGYDLPKGEPASPAIGEVLSAAYPSTNGEGQIRTAFSVPIKARDEEGEKVIGRLCMSLPINALRILDLKAMQGLHFRSMLVDMRDYKWVHGSSVGLVLDGSDDPAQIDSSNEPEVTGITKAEKVPRLAPELVERIRRAMNSEDNSRSLIAKSVEIGSNTPTSVNEEIAFMPIRMPHRNGDQAETGWIVLLKE